MAEEARSRATEAGDKWTELTVSRTPIIVRSQSRHGLSAGWRNSVGVRLAWRVRGYHALRDPA